MWKFVTVGVLGLVAVGAWGYVYNGDCSKRSLYSALKTVAAEQLRSPATATFEDANGAITLYSKDQCSIIVDGFVDSQNGFGATVRSSVSGVAKYAGGDYEVNVFVTSR
ncbi:hypothetical protein SAMN04488005_1505 [Yoonia tamlensis]|uniref:Uncharacterized protein n=1 Tax=Yoonia tamlensis TaxID=390270 RepID=A0A1I6GE39_9RHOB|nr:hypothetical protein [Yoonia tamlensis]SFR40473.1 hypothetical protein SAMN04488005_1505 [Yoonia tamlensis]